MANMNPMDFVMSMIRQNPNIARNPNAQSMLEVIQNNDAEKGRQIAKTSATHTEYPKKRC